MNIQTKIVKVLNNPFLIPRILKDRVLRLYKLHILKDQFTVAVTKWFRDRGDETLRLNYPLNEESVVFDLGGYKGDFAFEINKKYGCNVFVYEPVREFYEQCVLRFNNNPKVKCFNYGLSNETGEAFISDENDGSSVFKNNSSNNKQITLKAFKEEYWRLDISQIDLLKINVEGSEFLILPHLIQHDLIKNIKDLQVQFHTFFPNAELLRKDIRANLKKTHKEQWNYPFVWESWRLR
jgi:FkbM family methyltransferase